MNRCVSPQCTRIIIIIISLKLNLYFISFSAQNFCAEFANNRNHNGGVQETEIHTPGQKYIYVYVCVAYTCMSVSLWVYAYVYSY